LKIKNQGKGFRLRGNKVVVKQTNTGQFIITIPRSIAESILLQDRDVIVFRVHSRDSILLIRDKMTLPEYISLKEEEQKLKDKMTKG